MSKRNLPKIDWDLTRKLIFFSLILVVIGIFVYRTKVSASVDDLVIVGEEEYVLGPRNNIPDSSFFTVQQGSLIRGYTGGGGNTYSFSGTNLGNLSQQKGVALSQGTQGNFDECGAWLLSSQKLTDLHWIGWYHGEEDCNYSTGVTLKSMAFAESFDGGKTWTKPNYPNNRIITADSANNGNVNADDAGDGKVIKIGNYYYLYYLTTGPYGYNVARSLISDQGKPGTWFKYYNGDYTEAGLGGHSSILNNMDNDFVVHNSHLNRYMTGNLSGKWGLALDFSQGTNLLNWEKFPDGFQPVYPEVSDANDPTVDSWLSRNANSKQVYAYTSFVNVDGNSDAVGSQFYMYYMKVFPGEGFDKRYLMRRKVEIKPRDDAFHAKTLLTRYTKASPRRTKVSTEIAKPSEGYSRVSNVGYLASHAESGFHPLYECYDTTNNGYVIYMGDPSASNWTTCANSSHKYVRKIGYAADSATSTATLALNYCFDEANSDHFLSTDSNCEGKTLESLAGYIFPLSSASSPTPTVTPTPSPTPTSTPTPTPPPTGDTVMPEVQITSPANNGTVVKSTTVAISATASDNIGISKVEFYVNSVLKCTDTSASYQCNWKVPSGAGIVYNLVAKAFDTSNNQTSSSITVTSQ